MYPRETGAPVLVKIWSSGSWSKPQYYNSIEDLLKETETTNAGYGTMGQKWEIEGSLIAPPSPIYKKIIYAWKDENRRLQIANSIEEAKDLMKDSINLHPLERLHIFHRTSPH